MRTLIRPITISEGFTQSELTTFGDCAQKWHWRYNRMIEKVGIFSFALMVGSAFHDSMEQFYATKGKRVSVATLQFLSTDIPSADDYLKLEYWQQVLNAMVKAYCIYYKGDSDVWKVEEIEEEITVEYRGFTLRGKIDLRFSEGKELWIADHKSSGRLSKETIAGWDFRFQFMFYLWLKSIQNPKIKLKGYYINAVKKTELRVKKNESLPEFGQRVFEDMIHEPEKYFYRDKQYISKDALQHFQTHVVDPQLTLLKFAGRPTEDADVATQALQEAILFNKNTNECQHYTGAPCPYIDLCRHGEEKMGFLYTQKARKHMELEETE